MERTHTHACIREKFSPDLEGCRRDGYVDLRTEIAERTATLRDLLGSYVLAVGMFNSACSLDNFTA